MARTDRFADALRVIGRTDPTPALLADVQRLTSGGTVTIDGTTCDIVRMHPSPSPFAPSGMTIDLLIAQGEQPWVLGYDLNLPAMPERGMPDTTTIEIRATGWKVLDPDAAVFTFSPADAAEVEDVQPREGLQQTAAEPGSRGRLQQRA